MDGKEYVKANAKITSIDTVTVSAPEVVNPSFIHFAWDTLSLHNLVNKLVNKKGLPAIPFQVHLK